MSHVTGVGVAKLDSRHISDMLQILEDLYTFCYPGNKNIPGNTQLLITIVTCSKSRCKIQTTK